MNFIIQFYRARFVPLRQAIQNGTKLGITDMSFGDGGGSLPVPDSSFTHLVNEVLKHSLTLWHQIQIMVIGYVLKPLLLVLLVVSISVN